MPSSVREWIDELRERAGLGAGREGVVLAALALVVVAALWTWSRFAGPPSAQVLVEPPRVESAEATRAAPDRPSTLAVHVVGAVRRPGVYRLPAGSRAEEAVTAAGGAVGDAALEALNLARVLADGEQLVVPTREEAAAGAAAPSGGAAGSAGGAPAAVGGKVDLNTASAEQLDALPGIGPATAQKIVADREANGPFGSVDDLQRVPGIGQKKADGLKDLVVVR